MQSGERTEFKEGNGDEAETWGLEAREGEQNGGKSQTNKGGTEEKLECPGPGEGGRAVRPKGQDGLCDTPGRCVVSSLCTSHTVWMN